MKLAIFQGQKTINSMFIALVILSFFLFEISAKLEIIGILMIVLIFFLICLYETSAEPIVSGITGSPEHNTELIISGRGFGLKQTASPVRSSFMHPESAQNYQESGSFESGWSLKTGESIRLLDENNPNRVNRNTHSYYARLVYGEPTDGAITTTLPNRKVNYIAWYDLYPAEFDMAKMHSGNSSHKSVCFNQENNQSVSLVFTDDGEYRGEAPGGVSGRTPQEHDTNRILPFGGGWKDRPISWRTNYLTPFGDWYLCEVFFVLNSHTDTRDGWTEFRVNNQTLWPVSNAGFYTGDDPQNGFTSISFGGNYGWLGEENEKQYRYFGDMYMDNSFQRVVIGDKPNFEDCRHLELQMPITWSDTKITVKLNLGSFVGGDTVYLYVIDENNVPGNAYNLETITEPGNTGGGPGGDDSGG